MGLWRGVVAAGVVVAGGLGAARVQAQRLPVGVTPEHYALTITPDLAKARFAGSETIEVVLDKATATITLNAAEIEFVSVKAYRWPAGLQADYFPDKHWKGPPAAGFPYDLTKLDRDPQTATVTLDERKEQATFSFAKPLPAGAVTLQIEYTGIIGNQLRGFYLSKTKLRSYGVTQFEATDARRAFPCFDEPALKAAFEVSLVVDAGDTAISNTKIVSDKPGPVSGKHTIAFAATPKMSTYLVAWLVGDFKCTESKSDWVAIRACATPDKVALTRFALDAAKWDLHYYDKYFRIKYPLAKLDLVAVPDFEEGAMENFGCITFRETEMLVDEANGALPAKKEVAETVAHEMSHQWFGDLVTPEWWDNLWLNEGFATWMETKAPAKWQPKWGYAQDVAQDKNRTMDEDAGPATRAIRTQAETPAEIDELFDDIAYGKAGAVIAMVESWVGEEVFRKGVQAYLAAHLYGSAKAEDFWEMQARVSGLPVDRVMQGFVDQPGVPLLTIGGVGMSAPVTQRRFSISGSPIAAETWTIPVCFKGEPCRLLGPGQTTLDVPVTNSDDPFISANAADKGYYRTAYAVEEWKPIVANAEKRLTPPERIGLLGDRWALMRAGQGSVGEFLDLALAVEQDPNAAVMESALGRVGTIESRIATDADRERLEGVVRREWGPVYAALGGLQKHESYDRAELRETLFEALGDARDPAVLAEAQSMAKQLFAGQKLADPTMADAAVALATANGDVDMYERLQQVSQTATDPDLKVAALHALTGFQAPALVKRTLEYAVSDDVRGQDSWILISLLLQSRETQDQAWEFVEQHWEEIERKSTAGSGARIVAAAGSFCTVEKRDAVSSFFQQHRVGSSRRALARSIDSINDCIRLRAAQEPELRRWLSAHGGP